MASIIQTESDEAIVAAYEKAEQDMWLQDAQEAPEAWNWYLSRTVGWGMLTLAQKAELLRETHAQYGI